MPKLKTLTLNEERVSRLSNKLYRCMTLKYFFYHQIFFQDSAQTEILTVLSNPKYTAWTFWNTEHEHFEILSMKLNCKYWECMEWNPRNTDVATSVFRRYCDTFVGNDFSTIFQTLLKTWSLHLKCLSMKNFIENVKDLKAKIHHYVKVKIVFLSKSKNSKGSRQ